MKGASPHKPNRGRGLKRCRRTGKIVFRSLGEASARLRSSMGSTYETAAMDAYHCRHCAFYHIGHRSGSKIKLAGVS